MDATPLTLTCSLFDKGCFKCNRNNIRKAYFCISCSSEQLRSQNTNSGCKRAHMSNSQVFPAPSDLSYLRLSARESKQSLHSHNLGPQSALYATTLVSIGKFKLKQRKPSARTKSNTHADTIYMSDEVIWL